jgi:hypothetical protein
LRLQLPLTLTPAQAKIDADPSRFQILLAGRKFGKTKYAIYRCIKAAGRKNAVIWYIAPTYRQAKMIAWREFKAMIPKSVIETKNEQDLTIDLKNGATIYLMGADQPDSLRGPSPDFVVLEEAALHSSEVWAEVVRPALTARQGGALFITTPKGMNWFWELWEKAATLPEWGRFHFTVYDNPYISRDEIAQAERECHSDVIWRQEYLAEFESHLGRAIPAWNREKHFLDLPPYAGDPVVVGIDWGQVDDTAAAFGLIRNQRLEIHDYYGSNGLGAREQAQRIRAKWQIKKFAMERAVLSHDAFKQDLDRKGDTVAYRFQDEFYPVPVVRSDKQWAARTDLLITLASTNKLLIKKCPETAPLAEQIERLEWKDTSAVATKGKDDGIDGLGYLAMNVAFDLGLDRKPDDGNTKSDSDSEPRMRLRGFDRDDGERSPVFDPVTGYIGDSVF